MSNDLNRELILARTQLANLQEEMKSYFSPTLDPDDPKLIELDIKSDQLKARIRRLDVLIEAGRHHITAEATAALKKRRLEAAQKSADISSARIALAAELDAAFDNLGALLEKWRDVGGECRRNLALVHGSDAIPTWQESYLSLASGDNSLFEGALRWALFKHQIGLKGIAIDGAPFVRRPLGNPYLIEDAAINADEKLKDTLKNSLRLIEGGA